MLKVVDSDVSPCEAFFSHGDGAAINFSLKYLCLKILRGRHCMLLLIEPVIILSSFFIAYMIHFETDPLINFSTKLQTDFKDYFGSVYFWAAIIFTVLWLALMARNGLYRPRLVFEGLLKTEIKSITEAGLKSLVILMAVSFLFTGFLLSRYVYGIAFAFALILMITLRVILRRLSDKILEIGFIPTRTLIIGTNPVAMKFATSLMSNGFGDVVSYLEFSDERRSRPKNLPNCKFLGEAHEIDTISPTKFDRMIISAADFLGPKQLSRESLLMRILNHCEACRIPLYLISFSTDSMALHPKRSSLNGIPLLLLTNSSRHPVRSIIKRISDIFVSCTGFNHLSHN
jgi:FlaA1/EpsC-like NDP-sugar epimerase